MITTPSASAIRATASSTHWTLSRRPAGGLNPWRTLFGNNPVAGIRLLVNWKTPSAPHLPQRTLPCGLVLTCHVPVKVVRATLDALQRWRAGVGAPGPPALGRARLARLAAGTVRPGRRGCRGRPAPALGTRGFSPWRRGWGLPEAG